MTLRPGGWAAIALALVAIATSARAEEAALPSGNGTTAMASPGMRSGRDIYARFREGLADTTCEPDASHHWRRHFSSLPRRMTASDDVLPLFGYVIDALREAHLPTEYALIPFVESGYKPGARSASGPAGLWQMIGVTARNHGIAIGAGYDGRLSPVDSTQAAVRYLKTLHGMFAGDWRLAVMAYNAGEYRVFGALKRSGQRANAARPDELIGLSGITQAYVRKLHALSCLLDQADDRGQWLRSLDRPVPVLAAVALPSGTTSLDAWARGRQMDAGLVRRMNPAFADGRVGAGAGASRRILAPAGDTAPAMGAVTMSPSFLAGAIAAPQAAVDLAAVDAAAVDSAAVDSVVLNSDVPFTQGEAARWHTVARGESAWRIAHRYGLSTAQLLERNGLTARSVLRPGMVLTVALANVSP